MVVAARTVVVVAAVNEARVESITDSIRTSCGFSNKEWSGGQSRNEGRGMSMFVCWSLYTANRHGRRAAGEVDSQMALRGDWRLTSETRHTAQQINASLVNCSLCDSCRSAMELLYFVHEKKVKRGGERKKRHRSFASKSSVYWVTSNRMTVMHK